MSVKLVVAEQAEQRTYECFQPSIFPSICKWAQSEQTQDKNHTNFADILSEIVAVTSTLLWVWCDVPNSSVRFILSPKTSK